MYLRRSTLWKYILAALAGAALYCEWFVYVVQPQYWQRLDCERHNGSCTRILFVADPQIQGELAVPPPLSYLFNWDSDRYLRSTFSVVANSFKPNVIVFLGDMMDEGSISTTSQYNNYLRRLAKIFDTPFQVLSILLPGDNDIGGENEPIKKEKIEAFEKYFHQPSVVTYRNISFYKVNGITNTVPKLPEGEEDNNFKIVVSHYPVTMRYVLGQQVNKLHPDIYFCAHDHSSKYVKQDKDLMNRKVLPYEYGENILEIAFDEKTIYEIYVPTCSYRMGTSKIGFGAAILENNNQQMRYTVFWSPKRFPILFFYLAVLSFTMIYFLIFCAAKIFYRRPQNILPSADKQPLLDRI